MFVALQWDSLGIPRRLGVGPPAVSHAIARLETVVGAPVFTRSNRGVIPTPVGQRLHESISAAFAEIDHAVSKAAGAAGAASLTVSVSTSFASYWLMPRLAEFKRQHPTLVQRLRADDDDPLGHAPLIHLEERYSPRFSWADWFARHPSSGGGLREAYRSNDYSLVLQAALDGEGVALGWLHIVADLISDGRLLALDNPVETDEPFQILTRSTITMPPPWMPCRSGCAQRCRQRPEPGGSSAVVQLVSSGRRRGQRPRPISFDQ